MGKKPGGICKKKELPESTFKGIILANRKKNVESAQKFCFES